MFVDQVAQSLFMLWIDIGIEQADGDGLVIAFLQGGDQFQLNLLLIYRGVSLTVGQHPLRDFERIFPGYDRGRLLIGQVIDV